MRELLIILIFGLSTSAFAQIIGTDDREEFDGNPRPPRFGQVSVANSVAAMIHRDFVKKDGDKYIISAPSMGKKYRICEDVPFSGQLSAASCAGFLLAPYTMATSIGCIKTRLDCKDYYWVFNYYGKKPKLDKVEVKERYVTTCDKIVYQQVVRGTKMGHTFFQLEKRGAGIPISLETMRKLEQGDKVYSVAFPMGVPAKILRNGVLEKVGRDTTPLELDINSPGIEGAPVFHGETNAIVGMLLGKKLEDEIEYDDTKKCFRPKVCEDNCSGQQMLNILSMF